MHAENHIKVSINGILEPLRKLEDFFDVISPREEES